MEQLCIDAKVNAIINETNKDGIFWWIDERDPLFRHYMFVLDEETAARVIDNLLNKFTNSPNYGVIQTRFFEGHRRLPLELGFRRIPKKEYRGLKQQLHYLFGGLLLGFGHYEDLVSFAKVYIVDHSSDEAKKIEDDKPVSPPGDKKVLIINTPKNIEYKNALLDLMNDFYTSYQSFNPKTPSKT